jgi:hypothetical protein
MTTAEVKQLQRAMNRFTERFLENFPPLQVDGDRGRSTNRRISICKFYLGYEDGAQRSHRVTPLFLKRLSQPGTMPAAMIELARERRQKQLERARKQIPGVATFDGRKVATWLKPYLDFARENGWTGTITSGYRTPEESEDLCIEQCGQPSCPGKCAGRTSNHSGKTQPKGAVDVSDIARFARLMERCPLEPRIFNDLGDADPEHFSTTGH